MKKSISLIILPFLFFYSFLCPSCEKNELINTPQQDTKGQQLITCDMDTVYASVYGGEFCVKVSSSSHWMITTSHSWVTVQPSWGIGDALVTISVEAHNKICTDVIFTTEESSYTLVVQQATHGKIGNHEWVDLGLPSGTLWATKKMLTPNNSDNLYVIWGGTQPVNAGDLTEQKQTDVFEDVATYYWGENWKMPSVTEWNELLNANYCKYEWISDVCRITGIKTGEYIDIDASGPYSPSYAYYGATNWFDFWTLSESDSESAYYACFYKSKPTTCSSARKNKTKCVLPVVNYQRK